MSPTFDLEISITGLCLFVPDGKRLHVLLMNHHHAKHHARLIYDKVHEKIPSDRVLQCRPLEGYALILENLGDVIRNDVTLPPEIIDLDKISGGCKVPRKYLEGGSYPEVAGRITLGAGRFDGILHRAKWEIRERPAKGWTGELATTVRWKISGITEDELRNQFRFIELATKNDQFRLPLHPAGNSSRIEIEIYNSLLKDLPPVTREDWPTAGAPAEHFEVFFGICNGTPVVPVLAEDPPSPKPDMRATECKPHLPGSIEQPLERPGKVSPKRRTAHTVTCIGAQAPAES